MFKKTLKEGWLTVSVRQCKLRNIMLKFPIVRVFPMTLTSPCQIKPCGCCGGHFCSGRYRGIGVFRLPESNIYHKHHLWYLWKMLDRKFPVCPPPVDMHFLRRPGAGQQETTGSPHQGLSPAPPLLWNHWLVSSSQRGEGYCHRSCRLGAAPPTSLNTLTS